MRIVKEYPHKVRELPHVEVPMPDGCKLAARIWMPEGAESTPVPAILEYIPYRKNDLTAQRDESMHPYTAGHGYAVVRLDLRGTGESQGLMLDEYLPQELQDGFDAIAWIADQPWCDGNVGMMGISWGGFNGLQVAALQPPALKAVISVCSTDDRYADDVHYMGGAMVIDQLSWASIMFGKNTLPPDPRHVGEAWRPMWRERLEKSGLWLKNWLEHQTRDEFWKHGSICEDWSKVTTPIYAISGWADGYCRAVFRLMENLQGPKKGLIGPWAHKYPHLGQPGPAIGFLQEALRWWDHWLKGQDTGIMEEPMLRLYMQDPAPPKGWYADRPGRWVAEPSWPSPNIERRALPLGADGRLHLEADAKAEAGVLTHASQGRVGMASGKWCSYAVPGDQPGDQGTDDAGSLRFETAPLEQPLEIAGDAAVELELSVDKPVAQLAARIVDVHPNGAATRVCYGVLNLCHRDGHAEPEPLIPGERYRIRVPMKPVAQRFEKGHRLRLSLSTVYFPMIWPTPETVTLTLHTEGSRLELPVRVASPADEALAPFAEPEAGPELAVETLEAPDLHWRVVDDVGSDRIELHVGDGDGVIRIVDWDLTIRSQAYERYTVEGGDARSARGTVRWEYAMGRADWQVRTETETTLTSDPQSFIIEARLKAWEGDELAHEEVWSERIPRRMA
ncbi:MAG: CocE/NonD family hydrolase [Marivibrio sp.]|uniref:CocE/NonD family hydrolase n=1 Tax=Marivibrio sp. TaxID=2039719 RepID=UPI0032EC6343